MQTFTCVGCRQTFERGNDEAAAAECLEVFEVAHRPDDAVVCTTCYEEFLSAYGSPRERAAYLRRKDLEQR